MKRCKALLLALSFSVAGLVTATPDEASAGVLVGVDAGANVGLGDWANALDPGFGGAVRVGYELPIPVLRLVPELRLGYFGFSSSDNFSVLTGRAGGRAGIGGIIGPMVYAHVGYGRIGGNASDFAASPSGLSYDAGVAIDFTLLPLINLGIHGGYNALVTDGETLGWIEAGAHVELTF